MLSCGNLRMRVLLLFQFEETLQTLHYTANKHRSCPINVERSTLVSWPCWAPPASSCVYRWWPGQQTAAGERGWEGWLCPGSTGRPVRWCRGGSGSHWSSYWSHLGEKGEKEEEKVGEEGKGERERSESGGRRRGTDFKMSTYLHFRGIYIFQSNLSKGLKNIYFWLINNKWSHSVK